MANPIDGYYPEMMYGHGNTWQDMWANMSHLLDYGPLAYTFSPDLEPFQAWSRQMMSTMYQNWYNSAPHQMELMKQAGINPYLAANGIAGSAGTSSVASSPPQGHAAESVNAMANTLKSIAGVASEVVQSYDTLKTMSHRIFEHDAHSKQLLSDAGFRDAEADGIIIDNSYKDSNWLAELNIKRQQFDNMRADYQLIMNQKEFISKQLDWYDAQMVQQLSESESKALLNERMSFLVDSQRVMQDLENEFTRKYWSKMSDPALVALKNLALRAFDSDDPQKMFDEGYEMLIRYYSDKSEKEFSSQAAATWLARPSNAYEATAYVGSQLGKMAPKLFKFISSKIGRDAVTLEEIKANKEAAAEFNEAYDDAKSELYDNYRAARREYRSVKFSSASDSYKYETKQKMLNAKREYDDFTEEKFSNMLIEQVSGKKSIE